MSETAVPEDIMAAAREAFRGGVGYPPDTPIADSALIIYIARALLAERERCAKIAVSASEHLTACLERSSYSDHDVAVFESAISAANAIAVTIRTPTKQ